MQDIIQESTVGEQRRRAAVIVGRFNPPHAGHYAVLDEVKNYIKSQTELNLDPIIVCVIIDGKITGQDKTKNPLTAHERMSFMQGSGRANGVKLLIADAAMSAFEEVRKAGFEPIVVASGSDRSYVGLLDKYFRTANDHKIEHIELVLDRHTEPDKTALQNILDYMGTEIPTTMISGSLARLAVIKNDFDKFSIIVGLAKKPELARMMFKKITVAMTKDSNGTA